MIDFHAHYLPEDWPNDNPNWPYIKCVDDQYLYIQPRGNPVNIPRELFTLEDRLAKMDEDGVEQQVISAPPFTYTYNLEGKTSVGVCHHINNAIAEAVSLNARLIGLGTLPLQDIPASVEEIKRIKGEGLKGVTIGTSVNGKNLDDPALYPVWEELLKFNMPILLNSFGGIGSDRLEKYSLGNLRQWI